MAVSFLWSVQNFKMMWLPKNKLWANEISWDLGWKWVSDKYPILHSPQIFFLHLLCSGSVLFWSSFFKYCPLPFPKEKGGLWNCLSPFITCQNLHFGKYVGLMVCLFVRLFVRSRITLEPFEISSPKLVHRCILVAAPSLFLFKVKGQGHEVIAKVKIRNRRNSVNFLATAKF